MRTSCRLLTSILSRSSSAEDTNLAGTSDEYKTKILLHKPHPRKELLEYQVKQLIEQLEQEGLL